MAWHSSLMLIAQQLKSGFDGMVLRVKFRGTLIRIKGISSLVIATLILPRSVKKDGCAKSTYQSTQIIPHFRNVGIQSDGSRVGI